VGMRGGVLTDCSPPAGRGFADPLPTLNVRFGTAAGKGQVVTVFIDVCALPVAPCPC